MTGLLTWSDTPVGGWYDKDDQLVPESEIFDRYRDEVVARSGVRFFHDDGPLHDGYTPESAMVFLDRDITSRSRTSRAAPTPKPTRSSPWSNRPRSVSGR